MLKTQKSELLRYFKKGMWISQDKCKELTGSTRLSALMFDLRHKDGYEFISRKKKITNRYGNPCIYTEYKLVV
jgi:hypothetical protein